CTPSICADHTPPPDIYTLSLHDALPISEAGSVGPFLARSRTAYPLTAPEPVPAGSAARPACGAPSGAPSTTVTGMPCRSPESARSEEHTSELQSRENLVCRLLLEKKNTK